MKKILLIFLAALLFVTAGCGTAAEKPEENPDYGIFTVGFICIGKGDSFLLSTPQGDNYLVDTGKAEDFIQIARYLREKNVDSLKGIFLSHGHKDHAGSLDYLLSVFPTEKVYISKKDDSSYVEIDPREICARHGVELYELMGGEHIDLGGVSCEIWIPKGVDYKNENNNSVCMLLNHGEKRFIFMGDAELNEETALMASGLKLKADVLKLGHHGEDDATSAAFLDKIMPQLALIAGNEEENPESVNPVTQGKLSQRNIEVIYSDSDKQAWEIVSDGNNISYGPHEPVELPQSLNLSFSHVDRKAQRIGIKNSGQEPCRLDGCILYSKRGDEAFFFPENTVIAPGEELWVACTGSELEGDLIWSEPRVWHAKKDKAQLYDYNMNLLAQDPEK